MKKFFNFISKNKLVIILIIVLIAVAIVGFISMKAFLYPDDETLVYGDRLDGIEEVAITDEKINEVISKIKENENVIEANINIQGKIINISIKSTNEENTIEVMEELSSSLLENFSKEEIAFYDFQFFIKNEDANYNLIGYKSKISETISWDSDVIVSEVENNETEEE